MHTAEPALSIQSDKVLVVEVLHFTNFPICNFSESVCFTCVVLMSGCQVELVIQGMNLVKLSKVKTYTVILKIQNRDSLPGERPSST